MLCRASILSLAAAFACATRPPPDPATSAVSVEGVPVADGATWVRLHLFLRDAEGRPFAGSDVRWDASGSSNKLVVESARTDSFGEASALLQSTAAEEKVVTAMVEELQVTRRLRFAAGPPAGTSTLRADPQSAPADGASAAVLVFRVRDSHGNAVAFAPVTVQVVSGVASIGVRRESWRTDERGVFATSVRSTQAGRVQVQLRCGQVALLATLSFY